MFKWFINKKQSFDEVFKSFDLIAKAHTQKNTFSNPRLFKQLVLQARDWSQKQSFRKTSQLTAFEIEQLFEISYWHKITEFMLTDRRLLNLFFKWALRDKNHPQIFALFPSWVRHLVNSNLSYRIGRLSGKGIKIEKSILHLLLEGEWLELKDMQQEVEFSYGYKMTLSEVFKTFENKSIDAGNLEWSSQGIINWNSLELGRWNPQKNDWVRINLESADWFRELPVFEILSADEVNLRYHLSLLPDQWVVSAVSTRGKLNLDFNDSHSFLEIAKPNKDGSYYIYEFGKLASEFPQSVLDKLKMLCKTMKGRIAYPDESFFYTFREQAVYPLAVTVHEAEDLINELKTDIIKGWKGNLVYQIESENCAKWVFYKLVHLREESAFPDLFRRSLLDTEPGGPIGWIFEKINKMPHHFRVPMLSFFHILLGAVRSVEIEEDGLIVKKSLSRHEFFQHGKVFLPAMLNHRVHFQKHINFAATLNKIFMRKRVFAESLTQVLNNQVLKKIFKSIRALVTPSTYEPDPTPQTS